MSVTIYHNPACGTSRNTLAMIRASGVEPTIVEYLRDPPTREALMSLMTAMAISPRDLLRRARDTPYDALGLDDADLSDAVLVDHMMAHPILINRPIVVGPKGTVLARPSEKVLDVLDNPRIGRFVKEDGEVVEAG